MATFQMTFQEVAERVKSAVQSNNPHAIREAENLINYILNGDYGSWFLLFNLATIHMHYGNNGLALALLEKAHAIQPNSPEIVNNIATCYRREHHNEQADIWFQKMIELAPHDADAWNNAGTMHINEGTPEKGVYYFRKGLEINPGHYRLHWNLSLALLELGQWEEGFREYVWGQACAERMTKNYGNAVWWFGQPGTPDDKLVIYGEQGIGDEIMFMSIITDVLKHWNGKLIIDCHPRLIEMFEDAFPEVQFYDTRKVLDGTEPWIEGELPIKYKASIAQATQFFRKSDADFQNKTPYLYADKAKVAEYESWLDLLPGDGPVIGLSWVGGHKKTRKDLRAVRLNEFKALFDAFPNARFVSLQYSDHGSDDTEKLFAETGVRVWHFPEVTEASRWERWDVVRPNGEVIATTNDKEQAKGILAQAKHAPGNTEKKGWEIRHTPGPGYDYGETGAFAQAIVNLGGVIIGVNNSLVHLCGAMNIPMHTLTPSKPAWRYGMSGRKMPWYDSIIQHRQVGEDWSPAIAEAVQEVKEYLDQDVARSEVKYG